MEMRDAELEGVRLHWREEGAGELVLFVHGFPLHGGMWSPQLERLPRRWRLVAPDLRGFGRSRDEGASPLTMARHAGDLVALLDALGEDRAVVCGLSMGGYIAFELWRSAPERVRALILSDTRAGADTEEARRERLEMAERVLREGPAPLVESMLPKLLAPDAALDVRARVRQMMEATRPATIARALEGMAARPDSLPDLTGIDVAALVLVGSDDAITPPAEAERMADAIPEARLVVLDGAGHMSNMERPDAFSRQVTDFLDSLVT